MTAIPSAVTDPRRARQGDRIELCQGEHVRVMRNDRRDVSECSVCRFDFRIVDFLSAVLGCGQCQDYGGEQFMDELLARQRERIGFPRTSFRGPDELAAVYRTWDMDVVQLKPETGDSWTASEQLGDLRVWASSLTGRYGVRMGVPPQTVLVQISSGQSGSRRIGGMELQTSDILAGFAGLELIGIVNQQQRGTSFVMALQSVRQALADRAPGSDRLARGSAPLVVSNSLSRIAAMGRLVDAAMSLENARDRLLASSDIVDLLIGTILSPWHQATDLAFRLPTFQRLPIVRRAEEFMRARLGDPLTLQDICHAARASQRSVEYAFSGTYGLGPKQYLKALRLNAVRLALISQPPNVEKINQIARRHGIWHMGHFTEDYCRVFGETPQQTKARRWPQR
ncbi:helix-turn-helix domain-containing protein [Vineibacter terrae]|uniref:Helix-turn-helix domain-containing protein n=1 Tax=Vineibacter terrae TaxID=2586908 RepID=A0A5C8P8X6_9HYPH|nr:helix-turn-helix domain-containing protein [Vineibacter terrae]TXL69489.1 helix-turn-helix domain-containing protein [Vineibacter terrae]